MVRPASQREIVFDSLASKMYSYGEKQLGKPAGLAPEDLLAAQWDGPDLADLAVGFASDVQDLEKAESSQNSSDFSAETLPGGRSHSDRCLSGAASAGSSYADGSYANISLVVNNKAQESQIGTHAMNLELEESNPASKEMSDSQTSNSLVNNSQVSIAQASSMDEPCVDFPLVENAQYYDSQLSYRHEASFGNLAALYFTTEESQYAELSPLNDVMTGPQAVSSQSVASQVPSQVTPQVTPQGPLEDSQTNEYLGMDPSVLLPEAWQPLGDPECPPALEDCLTRDSSPLESSFTALAAWPANHLGERCPSLQFPQDGDTLDNTSADESDGGEVSAGSDAGSDADDVKCRLRRLSSQSSVCRKRMRRIHCLEHLRTSLTADLAVQRNRREGIEADILQYRRACCDMEQYLASEADELIKLKSTDAYFRTAVRKYRSSTFTRDREKFLLSLEKSKLPVDQEAGLLHNFWTTVDDIVGSLDRISAKKADEEAIDAELKSMSAEQYELQERMVVVLARLQ